MVCSQEWTGNRHEHTLCEYRRTSSVSGFTRRRSSYLSWHPFGKAGCTVQRYPELRAVLQANGVIKDRHPSDCCPQVPRTISSPWYVSVKIIQLISRPHNRTGNTISAHQIIVMKYHLTECSSHRPYSPGRRGNSPFGLMNIFYNRSS